VQLQLQVDKWQIFLQPHHVVRVYRKGHLAAAVELPVPLLVQLVSHYLAQAALTGEISALRREGPRSLARVPPRPRTLPLGPPSASQRASRRAARRSRR
jgi:hypothetical protein